ncbi:uncharacterized protein [Apostichopus japonicus]|uniref:uncharacterized protein n=1 Tax=Stichopus japonicus TaxID=307972 RepID=UPI003AB182A1
MALKLLQGLEKRLQKDPSLRSEYKGVVKKYVEKGYITKVKEVEVNDETRRKNLAHFLVVRTDKETTKVRIVFDASATSEVQPSLSDMIDAGPKLHRELFDVLLRFRHYKVALICDISEMYMQIKVAKVDISMLRFFLWDENHTDEPDVYEFKILPFRVHVAPLIGQYVAQTTLNCIGKNIGCRDSCQVYLYGWQHVEAGIEFRMQLNSDKISKGNSTSIHENQRRQKL